MADFTLDYSDISEGGTISDGDYEVVIKKAAEGTNVNGKSRINFDMIIRRDVDQRFAGAHIFEDFWPSKSDGKYNKNMLMQMAKSAGLENGKKYSDFGDFLSDFSNKALKVRVKIEKSEYNGTEYENIRVRNRSETKFPKIDLAMNNLDGLAGTEVEIADNELPF